MKFVKPHIPSFLTPILLLLWTPMASWANGTPTDNHPALTDGPHVFYQQDKILVKNFLIDGTNCKMEEQEFAVTEDVMLDCKLDPEGNVAFSFPLRKSIKAPRSVYAQPEKIFAISDIEGNFDAFVASLRGNGVIDYQFNWIYGQGHLVLVGDFFDRGDHVTACLWLIYKLEQEAIEQGGQVHFIIGNHEEMNMRGDIRYVDDKYKAVARSLKMHCKELYGTSTELGRWLRTRNIVEKIGNTIFVHGGLSPQLAASGLPLKRINAIARAHMGRTMKEVELREKGGKNTIVFAKTGPMWYRGYFNGDLDESGVRSVLAQYNAEHVVVGHTIMPEVSAHFNGAVYAIDVK
ncbi:MAG: metallophosphoesterase, partial [Bacteroidota bacterium]